MASRTAAAVAAVCVASLLCLAVASPVAVTTQAPPSVCVASYAFVGPNHASGLATAMTRMALALSDDGFPVTLLHAGPVRHDTAADWQAAFASRPHATVRYVQLGTPNLAGSLAKRRSNAVYQWLRSNPTACDVVHFHDYRGLAYYSLIAKAGGDAAVGHMAMVVQGHGNSGMMKTWNGEARTSEEAVADEAMEAASLELADVVTTPSQWYLSWLEANEGAAIDAGRAQVMANVLPKGLAGSADVCAAPGGSAPLRTIAFFGRQTVLKGLLVFLDALDVMCSASSATATGCAFDKVMFVGPSARLADGRISTSVIRDRCGDLSIPCEVVSNLRTTEAALARLAEERALAVLPSLEEPAPQALVECAVAGVPVIASRSGGLPELLTPDSDIFFAASDASSLAAKAVTVAAAPCAPSSKATATVTPQSAREAWSSLTTGAAAVAAVKSAMILNMVPESVAVAVMGTFDSAECLASSGVCDSAMQGLSATLAGLSVQTQAPVDVMVMVPAGRLSTTAMELVVEAVKQAGGVVRLVQADGNVDAQMSTAVATASAEQVLFLRAGDNVDTELISTLTTASAKSGAAAATCFVSSNGATPMLLGGSARVASLRNPFGAHVALVRASTWRQAVHAAPSSTPNSGYSMWASYLQLVAAQHSVLVVPRALVTAPALGPLSIQQRLAGIRARVLPATRTISRHDLRVSEASLLPRFLGEPVPTEPATVQIVPRRLSGSTSDCYSDGTYSDSYCDGYSDGYTDLPDITVTLTSSQTTTSSDVFQVTATFTDGTGAPVVVDGVTIDDFSVATALSATPDVLTTSASSSWVVSATVGDAVAGSFTIEFAKSSSSTFTPANFDYVSAGPLVINYSPVSVTMSSSATTVSAGTTVTFTATFSSAINAGSVTQSDFVVVTGSDTPVIGSAVDVSPSSGTTTAVTIDVTLSTLAATTGSISVGLASKASSPINSASSASATVTVNAIGVTLTGAASTYAPEITFTATFGSAVSASSVTAADFTLTATDVTATAGTLTATDESSGTATTFTLTVALSGLSANSGSVAASMAFGVSEPSNEATSAAATTSVLAVPVTMTGAASTYAPEITFTATFGSAVSASSVTAADFTLTATDVTATAGTLTATDESSGTATTFTLTVALSGLSANSGSVAASMAFGVSEPSNEATSAAATTSVLAVPVTITSSEDASGWTYADSIVFTATFDHLVSAASVTASDFVVSASDITATAGTLSATDASGGLATTFELQVSLSGLSALTADVTCALPFGQSEPSNEVATTSTVQARAIPVVITTSADGTGWTYETDVTFTATFAAPVDASSLTAADFSFALVNVTATPGAFAATDESSGKATTFTLVVSLTGLTANTGSVTASLPFASTDPSNVASATITVQQHAIPVVMSSSVDGSAFTYDISVTFTATFGHPVLVSSVSASDFTLTTTDVTATAGALAATDEASGTATTFTLVVDFSDLQAATSSIVAGISFGATSPVNEIASPSTVEFRATPVTLTTSIDTPGWSYDAPVQFFATFANPVTVASLTASDFTFTTSGVSVTPTVVTALDESGGLAQQFSMQASMDSLTADVGQVTAAFALGVTSPPNAVASVSVERRGVEVAFTSSVDGTGFTYDPALSFTATFAIPVDVSSLSLSEFNLGTTDVTAVSSNLAAADEAGGKATTFTFDATLSALTAATGYITPSLAFGSSTLPNAASTVAAVPELRAIPVVVTQSLPEGWTHYPEVTYTATFAHPVEVDSVSVEDFGFVTTDCAITTGSVTPVDAAAGKATIFTVFVTFSARTSATAHLNSTFALNTVAFSNDVSTMVNTEWRAVPVPIVSTLSVVSLSHDNVMMVTATFSTADGVAWPHVRDVAASQFVIDTSEVDSINTELVSPADPTTLGSQVVLKVTVNSELRFSSLPTKFLAAGAWPPELIDSNEVNLVYSPPTPTLTSSVGVAELQSPELIFTATFTSDVSGFTGAAFGFQTDLDTTTVFSQVDARTYTLAVTIGSTSYRNGQLSINIAESAAGVSPATAKSSAPLNILYRPPTPTLTVGSHGAVSNINSVEFDLDFTSPVSNITASSFGLVFTPANVGASVVLRSDSTSTYRAVITFPVGVAASVTSTIAYPLPFVTPKTGGAASASIEYAPPVVSWSSTDADSQNVVTSPSFTFTASFSQVDLTPVNVAGVTVASFGLIANPAGTSYTTSLSSQAGTSQQLLTVTVTALPAGATSATFSVKLDSTGVTPAVQSSVVTFTLDYRPPTPAITTASESSTNNVLQFTATFRESANNAPVPVAGVTASSFDISTALAYTASVASDASTCTGASCSVYVLTVNVDAPVAAGSVTVGIPAAAAGVQPPNNAADASKTIAYTPVTVTLSASSASVEVLAGGGETTDTDITVTATFSEAVTGVTRASFGFGLDSYVASTAATAADPVQVSGTVWTMTVSALPGTGGVGFVSAFDGSMTSPRVAPGASIDFSYKCSGVLCLARREVYSSSENADVDVGLVTRVSSAGIAAGVDYSWTQALGPAITVPAAATQVAALGKLACGDYEFHVKSAVTGQDAKRFVTLRIAVDSYSVSFGTLQSTIYAGRAFTVPYTACMPNSVFLSLELRASATDMLDEAAVSAADQSATLTAPLSLPSGAYVLALTTLPAAALSGNNQDLEIAVKSQIQITSPFRLETGTWSECSVKCGLGTQDRAVRCMDDSQVPPVETTLSSCSSVGIVIPSTTQNCYLSACVDPAWFYTSWSACSEVCGFGSRSRTATCIGQDGQTVVADDQCKEAKLPLEEECNKFACPTYGWVSFEWGKCSAPCGTATQNRFVACKQDGTNQYVADGFCAGAKPATIRNCENQPNCADPFFSTQSWSACSVTCGTGESNRVVQCHADSGQPGSSDFSACTSVGLIAPSPSKVCNTQPCLLLAYTPWTDCTATCGGGSKTRTATCRIADSDAPVGLAACVASGLVLQPTAETCNAHACPLSNFCDNNEDCNLHGSCDPTVEPLIAGGLKGACVCKDGFTGDYCEAAESCAAGEILDGNNECCDGTLDQDLKCCSSKVFFTNAQGVPECCPLGKPFLNACGECTDLANDLRRPDSIGGCCEPGNLAGGVCCEGTIDVCGVCNGVGACPRVVASAWSTTKTASQLVADGSVQDYTNGVRANMGLDNSHGLSTQVTDKTARRLSDGRTLRQRMLAGLGVDAVTTLTPSITKALDAGVMSSLASGAQTAPVTGATVDTVAAPVVKPVCGNTICETGEVCGVSDSNCCIADCPSRYIECPTAAGVDSPCNAKGTCDYGSGVCSCILGYAGAECASCADGYRLQGGFCVTFRIANTTVVPPPEPVPEPVTCFEGVCVPDLTGGTIMLIAIVCIAAFIAVVLICKWLCVDAYPKEDNAGPAKAGLQLQTPAQMMAASAGFGSVGGLQHAGPAETRSFAALKSHTAYAAAAARAPETA